MPRLDYVARLDPRNLAHLVTVADDPAKLAATSRAWTPGTTVLDQGQEGACVGFGTSGEAAASPVRVPGITNATAQAVYTRAKEIDEFEGVDYDGTSVRAGMLVGRERGYWTGFRWAKNATQFRQALEEGPIVIGIEWREGMYSAPNGLLVPYGAVVGGHCLLVVAYTPRHPRTGKAAYKVRNSWGLSFGLRGDAWIDAGQLMDLIFGSGGEAAVATGRKLP